jgi:hypothetical protein
MTNEEMMRPCALPAHWKQKKPIDACEVSGIQRFYEVGSKDKYHITINFWNGDTIQSPQIKEANHYDCANAKKELNHIQFLIYDALNAPVLATEEVLAGLSKDAEIWVVESFSSEYGERITYDKATYGKWYDQEDYKYYGSSWVYKCFYNTVHHKQDDIHIEYPMRIQDGYKLRIIADKDDPKTADYLRQFTLEGVRKETKDV